MNIFFKKKILKKNEEIKNNMYVIDIYVLINI